MNTAISSQAGPVRAKAASSDRSGRSKCGLLLIYALLVAVTCGLAPGYALFQGTQLLIYVIAILGLNLLVGFNGQLSLGHGAFYAIGAYSAAMLTHYFSFPIVLAVASAGGLCLVVGFLFGFPATRLAGHYLALATFALSVATPQLLKHRSIEEWTGGAQGLVVERGGPAFGLPVNSDQWLFLVSAAITAVMFVLAYNLVHSRIGRALEAIRDQPVAAVTMGIPTTFHRAAVFGLSTLYVGVAGAMAAMLTQFVSPDSYTLSLSISLLVGVVLGGTARLSGAVWGALFILLAPNALEHVSKSAPGALYGALLILVILLMPGGAAGALAQLRARWAARRSGRHRQDYSSFL